VPSLLTLEFPSFVWTLSGRHADLSRTACAADLRRVSHDVLAFPRAAGYCLCSEAVSDCFRERHPLF